MEMRMERGRVSHALGNAAIFGVQNWGPNFNSSIGGGHGVREGWYQVENPKEAQGRSLEWPEERQPTV